MEKRRCQAEFTGDGCEKTLRATNEATAGTIVQGHLELEKRARREIANNNERRRMQSINAGFDSLRILLPPTQDGEKMSKATILQLTAKYINTLLLRVSILENEVASYRQSAGIQPTTLLPDLSTTVSVSRKRKVDDQKKRTESSRTRRRRADVDPIFDTPIRNTYISCSSDSTDHHQPSSLNSFSGSISVSPTSPQPESTSTTAARLEHLVMAIEQIEGGGTLNVSPQPESHDGSFSAGDQSPPLPPETYWQSPQENYHGYPYADPHNSIQKGTMHGFSDVLMLTSVSEISNPVSVTPISDDHQIQPNSDDYPIVAKLLNRPIPHKYLHRPQVVVNSSH